LNETLSTMDARSSLLDIFFQYGDAL
jgi:hypothetical protein